MNDLKEKVKKMKGPELPSFTPPSIKSKKVPVSTEIQKFLNIKEDMIDPTKLTMHFMAYFMRNPCLKKNKLKLTPEMKELLKLPEEYNEEYIETKVFQKAMIDLYDVEGHCGQ